MEGTMIHKLLRASYLAPLAPYQLYCLFSFKYIVYSSGEYTGFGFWSEELSPPPNFHFHSIAFM